MARRLGLEQPAPVQPPLALEITSLRSVEGDIVDYTVVEGSRADGRLVRELNLPDGAVVAMLARGNEIIAPRGATRCRTGDHAFLVVKPDVRRLVDRVFAPAGEVPEPLPAVEFPLSAGMRVADLEEFYGITVEAPPDCTLAELMALRAEGHTDEGTAVQLGNVVLTIRERSGDQVEWIGLRILTQEE
ncbi:MAG TPA: TrkA C-terminal domain-containing protein [Longimicrobiales bacterium]|nr:TrkA C-terminal domain-containing protein [Longimicrobiales bacterium]